MKFNYNKIPEKTKLVHALKYKKIAGMKAKQVDLEDPNLFEKMQKLGWKMVKTCIEDNGVGLAATQLGIPKNVFVVIGFDEPYVWKFDRTFNLYMNPVIIPVKDSEVIGEKEGCLSVPKKALLIMRPREVDVEYWYFDENGKLKNARERLKGHLSRIFQHEFHHLNGIDIVELHKQQNTRKKRGRPPGSTNKPKIEGAEAQSGKKEETPKKRGRGRPKGSKDKKKRKRKNQ